MRGTVNFCCIIHHLGDMKTNFGMINLGIDGFFHSLAIEDHRLKKKQQSQLGDIINKLFMGK